MQLVLGFFADIGGMALFSLEVVRTWLRTLARTVRSLLNKSPSLPIARW